MRVRLRFIDTEAEHAPGVAVSVGPAAADVADVEAPLALDRGQAQRVADAMAEQMALQRARAQFAMAADGARLEAGDVVELAGTGWRIVEASDGGVIRFEAVRVAPKLAPVLAPILAPSAPVAPPAAASPVEPDVVIVDAPPLPGEENDLRPIGFAFAAPWPGPITISAGADATDLTARGRIAQPCTMGWLETPLHPFDSGRWQEASVRVRLAGAGLSSRNEVAVLNGANAALVETEAGWELIQFAEAELVDAETWELTRLLRGQEGSEQASAEGPAIGARILFLTGAEQRLKLGDWERGLELSWRAWRGLPEVAEAWSEQRSCDGAASRAWSPAHLAASWSGGDLAVSWIRRARKGGDSWAPGDPPHESPERYRTRVCGPGGVLREWDVAEPLCVYPASSQAADFPFGGEARIEIAQLGASGESGAWAALVVEIPT